MGKKKSGNRTLFDPRLYICLFIVLFVLSVLSLTILYKNSAGFDETETPFGEGWMFEDGSEADLGNLTGGKTLKFSKPLTAEEIADDALCFDTKNIYFSVYADDELIYDFRPAPPKLFGKSYGTFFHTVMIPNIDNEVRITIVADNLYEKTSGYIKNIKLCNSTSYLLEIIQGAAPQFLLCLGVLAFGIVFFIIGIIGRYFGDNRYEIIAIGTLAIVSALWMATENPLFALITNAPISVHFLNYISLMFIPFPTVFFATFITGNQNSRLTVFMGILCGLNFTFSIISNLTGWKDYHELLWISHVIIVLMIIILILLLIRGIVEKKIKKWLLIVMIITNVGPVAVGAVEMIRYRLSPGAYSMTSGYKYSIFVFIILYGIYECINISEMSRKSQYAEIMEHIAYTDGMTGLLNREAFNVEYKAAEEGKQIYTIVVMDLNHLKKVNDKLGHTMGDEYIKNIGRIIKEAFGKNAKCFRIGGDEFFVMTTLKSSDNSFQNCIIKLNAGIEEYNKGKTCEYPLSIAIGYVEYNPEKCRFEEAFGQADNRMYEQKKKMRMEVKKDS